MPKSINRFYLDVTLPGKPPLKIDIIDTLTAGLDPRSDLVLIGKKIKNQHFVFSLKGENLALTYLGKSNQSFLNGIPLEENKSYILESRDFITCDDIQIAVFFGPRGKLNLVPKKEEKIFEKNTDEAITTNLYALKDLPKKNKIKKEAEKNPFFFDLKKIFALFLIKINAFLIDLLISYIILIITAHYFKFTSILGPILTIKNSFLLFYLCVFTLQFLQTIILGASLGQMICGLKYAPTMLSFRALIFQRMKAILYSALLIGSQSHYSSHSFFRATRKIGLTTFLALALITPFLLPSSMRLNLTQTEESLHKKRELRTRTLSSNSYLLGFSLIAELPHRYYILPVILEDAENENYPKRSFSFTDLKTKEEIFIHEIQSISYDEIEQKLAFANPLLPFYLSDHLKNLTTKDKKEFLKKILLNSPVDLKNTIFSLGPFYGSSLILKDQLINHLKGQDILAKFYLPETPLFTLSNNLGSLFYLLSKDSLTIFKAWSPKKSPLITIFEEEILLKMVEDQSLKKSFSPKIEILEVQDNYIEGSEESFLTYYDKEVINLTSTKLYNGEEDLTPTAQATLVKNINSVQTFIKNKNVSLALNDIKKKLMSMEKPGEQNERSIKTKNSRPSKRTLQVQPRSRR